MFIRQITILALFPLSLLAVGCEDGGGFPPRSEYEHPVSSTPSWIRQAAIAPNTFVSERVDVGDGFTSNVRCAEGAPCEHLEVTLHDDGTYSSRGVIDTGYALCDRGTWTEPAPGEIAFDSCSGDLAHMDWDGGENVLDLGPYAMETAPNERGGPCDFECHPFWMR